MMAFLSPNPDPISTPTSKQSNKYSSRRTGYFCFSTGGKQK
jgi:hypothetical protein